MTAPQPIPIPRPGGNFPLFSFQPAASAALRMVSLSAQE